MNVSLKKNWHDANQTYLLSAIESIRRALKKQLCKFDGAFSEGMMPKEALDDQEQDDLEKLSEEMDVPPALEVVSSAFGLSPFERDLLILCAGAELDSSFSSLCVAAHGDPARSYPTFDLAMAVLPGPHWSAITPAAPLRRWRLIEIGTGNSLIVCPLRIDERVLHYLVGLNQMDERLAGIVEPIESTIQIPFNAIASYRTLAENISSIWSKSAGKRSALPAIQLCGNELEEKRAIAAAACSDLGLSLCSISAGSIPTAPAELDTLVRLWERESALSASALLIDCEGLDASDAIHQAAEARLVEHIEGPIFVTSRTKMKFAHRPVISFDVNKPAAEEQIAICRSYFKDRESYNGELEAVLSQFNLSAQAIQTASIEALSSSIDEDCDCSDHSDSLVRTFWNACKVQARPRIDDLAQRVEPAAAWDDLVLPQPEIKLLREVAAHVRQRAKVYRTWGFANKGSRGLGITALFSGPSGTGKTMAAEVLAGELGLDLYKIDLSQAVSKYIGETEKNLKKVFDAAEEGGAILLFDEADALFGKRSEVKDSHDRYANLEISYLLQRMEEYRGLAILTTNMKSALDKAFMRRIKFIVQFPFPNKTQRAEIWSKIFPGNTPVHGLDYHKLADLNVSGGSIRNIALYAAFLAADAGEPVRMKHLLRAARVEYAKMEQALTEAEVRDWI